MAMGHNQSKSAMRHNQSKGLVMATAAAAAATAAATAAAAAAAAAAAIKLEIVSIFHGHEFLLLSHDLIMLYRFFRTRQNS